MTKYTYVWAILNNINIKLMIVVACKVKTPVHGCC